MTTERSTRQKTAAARTGRAAPAKNGKPPVPQVNMNIKVEKTLHHRLRVRCIRDGLSLREAITAALTMWLKEG